MSNKGMWYGSAGASFGFGNVKAPTDTASTSVGVSTIELVYGFRIAGKFLLGAMTSYNIITQFSSVDQTVGNRRGSYLNYVAPMIGVHISGMFFRAAYQLMGSYDFTNLTYTNQSVSYSNPSGFKIELGLDWPRSLKPYFFFEQVGFGKKLLAGQETTASLPLTLQQYGMGVAIIL